MYHHMSIVAGSARAGLVLAALLLVTSLVGCAQDITHDPAYIYDSMAGRRFKLRIEMFLDRGQSKYADYWAVTAGEDYQTPPSIYAYRHESDRRWSWVRGNILEVGTIIRLDRVFYNEYDGLWAVHPTAVVCDGPLKGARIELYPTWLENPTYLTPVQ